MKLAILMLGLVNQAPSLDKYTLSFFQDNFVVRMGTQTWRTPINAPAEKPRLSVAYRKGQTYAVWDDRGLTIRRDAKVYSTRLPEIAVSPRAFPRNEILANLELIRRGSRSKNASSLAGSVRFGSLVFFLIRWEDKAKTPWLEALVQINLNDANPRPKLLGRFDGFSLAQRPIDDVLTYTKGRLLVTTQRIDSWGNASFTPEDRLFNYEPMGSSLVQYQVPGTFIEGTAYGTSVAGILDPRSGRKTLAEFRGKARILDFLTHRFVRIETLTGALIHNLETGAERPVAKTARIKESGANILIWTANDQGPTEAKLYSGERLEELARWFKS